MKITAVEFERRQLGWVCRIYFSLTVADQFTDTAGLGVGLSTWWLLAWWRARRSVKLICRARGAKPGERAAKGWSD